MEQKIFVVIGVGPGLGLSLVRKLSSNGFSVVMIARNLDKLQKYQDNFEKEGFSTYAFPADASQKEKLIETLHKIIETFGKIDLLIFNASVLSEGNPSEINVDKIENDLKINLGAAVVSTQVVLAQMKKQGSGTILFTGSGAGLAPIPSIISLSISKVALRFYAKALAGELKNSNIYAGTITINGTMEKNTNFDPDKIAETFWWMYKNKPDKNEFIYE